MTGSALEAPDRSVVVSDRLKAARAELEQARRRQHIADRHLAEAELAGGELPDASAYDEVTRIERLVRGLELVYVRTKHDELEARRELSLNEHARLAESIPYLDQQIHDLRVRNVPSYPNAVEGNEALFALHDRVRMAARGASLASERADKLESEFTLLRNAHPEAFLEN